MNEGEFISQTLMNFGEVIDKSKDWDQKSPYIPNNELFMTGDLTENDLVIRQINVAKILERLLNERMAQLNSPVVSAR